MASLVADYASSDDESPVVAPIATASAAQPVTTKPSSTDDEDLDDEAAEEKARGDLFGLTDAQVSDRTGAVVGHLGAATSLGVSAAPDVLAEVWCDSNRFAWCWKVTVLTDSLLLLGPKCTNGDDHTPDRQGDEREYYV